MKKIIIFTILFALILSGCGRKDNLSVGGPDNGIKFKKIKIDKDDIEIGNISSVDFEPEAKLEKWKGESYLRVWSNEKGDKNSKLEGGKVKWRANSGKDFHFYTKPEGFEYEIILNKIPSSNIIELEIETQNLEFYYQPKELSEFEKSIGANRPDNVKGSYAVYHKNKKNNKYKTGKAYHIYRPELIDSKGDRIWADIDIKNGKMTITMDSAWLNNASYPVIVDPTFGDTGIGGSNTSIGDIYIYTRFTLGEAGDVSKLTGYFNVTTASKNTLGGIYSAYNLVTNGTTNEVSVGTGAGWTDFTFSSQPSLTAGDYELLMTMDGGAGSGSGYYDVSSSVSHYVGRVYDSSLPNPIISDGQDLIWSIYATYTASGGGVDSCVYSGSGDWNINYSDNCLATTTTYVDGDCYFNYDGAGSFAIVANTTISCDDMNIGSGFNIDICSGCLLN